MTLHVHALRGCTPDPLAHYLKALGVLRLVAAQADTQVRGWWQDDHFRIVSVLDRSALLGFFAERYVPTPMLAPWNGGSGFYPKDNKNGIEAVRRSTAHRFTAYREAITHAAEAMQGRLESPKDEDKQAMLGRCRREWRGPAQAWLDAAVVIDTDLSPAYPSLLGTGGNDGRLDFTNNAMQRLTDLFDLSDPQAPPHKNCLPLLASALFADTPTPGLMGGAAIGQFLPGAAGGANSSSGFDGDSLVNPWDFLLMLEGAVAFSSGLSRRLRSGELPQAAAPFALRSAAVGFGTAVPSEESARGEQWLPLWNKPATHADVAALLAEGRCQQGRMTVRRPVEMARALARHGTARGISAFQRVAFLERNGQANLAIPLGRWTVQEQPAVSLVDELAPWVDNLERAARDQFAPARWRQASRRCSEAMIAVCRTPQPQRWAELFLAVGAAEAEIATVPGKAVAARLSPLPRLSSAWVTHLAHLQAPFRLALAFADQIGVRRGRPDANDSVRQHWLPMDRFHFSDRVHPRVIPAIADAFDRLARVVHRRVIEESPLASQHGHSASLADIAGFLTGAVPAGQVADLIGPCLALDRSQAPRQTAPDPTAEDIGALSIYGALRLATMPQGVWVGPTFVAVPWDRVVITTLAAGHLDRALAQAVHRLRTARLRPFIDQAVGNADLAARLAASLAFPIDQAATRRLVKEFTKPDLA